MLNSRRTTWGTLLAVSLLALGCGADGKDGAVGPAGKDGVDGATGSQGETGSTGETGSKGDPADVPVLKNDVSVTVTDGTNPVSGVAITMSPGTATGTTDAQGKATIAQLDVGTYIFTFKLAGYLDQTVPVAVSLAGPSSVQVVLGVDMTVGAPTLATTDNLMTGFGKSVTLQVAATGKGPFTYAWKQIEGPEVTLTGADTDSVTYTSEAFQEAMGESTHENARFGTLGVNPDQAGNYHFEVTVKDADGRETKAHVKANSTRPTTGLRMVPIGVPVWLQGDGPAISATQTTWNWTLDKTAATGSTAVLQDATSQFPSFVPDKVGAYTLVETVANKTLKVYAGTWSGSMTADGSVPSLCANCHGTLPAATDNWAQHKNTKHFSSLHEEIDGISTSPLTADRLATYTVGYDKTATNGGFDDVEPMSTWTFPATLEAGNWDKLVADPKLGPLAGIQCENCHGPQVGPSGGPHTSSTKPTGSDVQARISWSADVCASCHQQTPYGFKPGQWAIGAHASLELAIEEGARTDANSAHCGRCHAAQGYARYVGQLNQDYYAFLTSDGKPLDPAGITNTKATPAQLAAIGMNAAEVQPPSCAACHDPHGGANPAQLRIYDTVSMLPSGLDKVSGMGSGVICVTCHNSRNAEHTDYASNTTDINGKFISLPGLVSFGGPHASAQSDFVFGFNAYFMPRKSPSAHLAVKDTCAGCHVNIATKEQEAAGETSNHSFRADNTICGACHGATVNGEALQAVNLTQIDSLRALWASKTLTTLKAAVNFVPVTGTMDVAVRAYDPITNAYSTSSSTVTTATAGMVHLTPANAPTKVDAYYTTTGTLLLAITVPTAVTFQPVTSAGPVGSPVTTNVIYANVSTLVTNQAVPTTLPWWTATAKYTVFSVPAPASGTVTTSYPALPAPPAWVVFNDVQTLFKAYWNFSMLTADNTKGIHNPSFFNGVVSATSARLLALP